MSASELTWRSLHDLGLAGWFGGSLLGPLGPIASTEDVRAEGRTTGGANGTGDGHGAPTEDAEASAPTEWSSDSMTTWSPVMAGAMALHLVGGAGLLLWNKGRLASQRGVLTSTAAKTAVTAGALGLTWLAWRDHARAAEVGLLRGRDGHGIGHGTAHGTALTRRRAITAWLLPVATGSIVVLSALEGEQQRPRESARGLLANIPGIAA